MSATDRFLELVTQLPEMELAPGVSAYTDRGSALPLWKAAPETATTPSETEGNFVRTQRLDLKVIQTSPPDLNYNCHGWIFAAGQHWVRGKSIDQILRENDYRAVTQPQPGDLAVYRDPQGEVAHTALVRMINPDGMVLVESKWGQLGRFLHTSTQHAYAAYPCTFYRSVRDGHVLRGIQLPVPAKPSMP